MTSIEKINLSFRCNESLNKMTSCTSGLHCSSCNKTVVDFRKSNFSQLSKALEEHGTVCGIFTESQTIHKPKYSTNIFKRYATSLLFAIGLGAFSKETIAQSQICDTLTKTQIIDEDTPEIFFGMVAETMPIYKYGGEKGLLNFLKENVKYPSDSLQGKVFVGFTIDTSGKVIDERIIRGIGKSADNEVLRVVKLLEFYPGIQAGKKVQVSYTLPVTFNLDNDKKKKKQSPNR